MLLNPNFTSQQNKHTDRCRILGDVTPEVYSVSKFAGCGHIHTLCIDDLPHAVFYHTRHTFCKSDNYHPYMKEGVIIVLGRTSYNSVF